MVHVFSFDKADIEGQHHSDHALDDDQTSAAFLTRFGKAVVQFSDSDRFASVCHLFLYKNHSCTSNGGETAIIQLIILLFKWPS